MTILGASPTRTGISCTVVPEPSASLIRSLRIPISPATASSGGVTKTVTVVDSNGCTVSALSGYEMFHPAPALSKYGARGAFPSCSTVSVTFCPAGSMVNEVFARLNRQPDTWSTVKTSVISLIQMSSEYTPNCISATVADHVLEGTVNSKE